MEHYLALSGIAISLFASTNIDDLFVLLGFFSDRKFKLRQVVVGQLLGIAVLYGVSVTASLISLVIAPAYIGLLGLAPIYIGAKKAWDLYKSDAAPQEDVENFTQTPARRRNVIAVAAVTIANGADNISIYTPVFAIKSSPDIALIGLVFVIMTLLWVWAAHGLTYHRTLGAPIRRYGYRIVPFVLIGLGVLILYDAGSFGLLN